MKQDIGGASSAVARKMLRLPAVIGKTGLSRSAIYAAMGQNEFPKAVRLTHRSVGWVDEEIDFWIAKRIEASRG